MEVALEADLLPHLLEILGDPRDFAKSELMDLVGGHRQCRRRLDLVAVERVAALHVHQSDAVARVGKIFVLQEVAHARQRRIDDAGDRTTIFLVSRAPVGRARFEPGSS